MGTIGDMTVGIMVCQGVIVGICLIFMCFVLAVTYKKKIKDWFKYVLFVKLFLSISLNMVSFGLIIVLMLSSMSLDAKEIEYYTKKQCVSQHVSYQFSIYEDYHSKVLRNAIIMFLTCFL
jgi:hypothetical protein